MVTRTDDTALLKAALATTVIAGILVALVFGRGFLAPIVLAILLSSLLSNAITRMHKLGTPVWLATTIALGSGFVFLLAVGWIVQSQFQALEVAWPQYVQRIETLLGQISALTGQAFVDKVSGTISNFDVGGLVTGLASSAGTVFNELVLVFLYTMFLLAERGTVVGKLARLFPAKKDRDQIESNIRTVSQSVQKYLSIKTLVSSLTGVLTFVVAKYYGVHFSELIGLLAFILNFIPVIGSFIAVVIPVFLAIVQFDTLGQAFQIAILLGLVQATVGNVIEPRLMGKSLNLSAFVVIVALTFWTTIWGVVGAFLSVPITATAVIICRGIKPLRWIAVLLSVDGNPEPAAEPKTDRPRFSWLTGRRSIEREEIAKLQSELEALRAEQGAGAAKPVPPRKQKKRSPASQRAADAAKPD